MSIKNLTFTIPSGVKLSAILQQPAPSRGLFVMGHSSGSNIRVPLMTTLADALFAMGIATLRFQYPFSESRHFVPFSDMPVDNDAILTETIQEALKLAHTLADSKPVFVGGHSISGFMTTVAAAQTGLDADAIIALAFPRKGDPKRSAHLSQIRSSVLIVQGTEDTLGTQSEIREMAQPLQPHVQVQWIEEASHAFAADGIEQHEIVAKAAAHIDHFVARF